MDYTFWDKQTKNSWLSRILKKNTEFSESDLVRLIQSGIKAQSFAFPTDVIGEGNVLKPNDLLLPWKVGIDLTSYTNAELKTALDLSLLNGAEYLSFQLDTETNLTTLHDLFDDVYLDMVVSRWQFLSPVQANLAEQYIRSRFTTIDLFFIENHPAFSIESSVNHSMIYKFPLYETSSWVNILIELICNLKSENPKLLFEIKLGHDFLLNISSLRALKLVLAKIWKIYNLRSNYYIEVRADESIVTEDVYSNIYKMTTIALSASVAGVDYISLTASDGGKTIATGQWLKTALHSLHILKQEAQLSKIHDPLAGSYYIENLTEQICQQVWLQIQQRLIHD